MTDKREMMHGVRQYDTETGRFLSVDPLWEKYYDWNPYVYSVNNSISFLDLSGLNWFVNNSGTVKWHDKKGSFSEVESGITLTDVGPNVVISKHARNDEIFKEKVGAAIYKFYLETNHNGPVAIELGDTVPTNISKRGVLAEGLYQGKVTRQLINNKDRGDLVVLLEGGKKQPSLKPNPAQNEKLEMTEIFIHWGAQGNKVASNGCQTISPGNKSGYNAFMSFLKTINANPVGFL